MQGTSYAQQGWDFAANIVGADMGSQKGEAYVDAVEKAVAIGETIPKSVAEAELKTPVT